MDSHNMIYDSHIASSTINKDRRGSHMAPRLNRTVDLQGHNYHPAGLNNGIRIVNDTTISSKLPAELNGTHQ